MDTSRNDMPPAVKNTSFSRDRSRSPSACAAIDTRRPSSAIPDWLKSPVILKATREAGLTLYEILGMVELMRVAYEKGEMESVQNRLALLMSEAASLSSALVNIVELSRLETATATSTYRSFDIVALLNEVSQTTRLNTGHKAVTIMDVSSTGPVMILSDPVKVRKIITGLLSNAAKFTDRGRIALILISDENGIRLIITDTGRGMTAEQMNDAFAPCSSCGGVAERGHAESVPGLRQIRNLVKLLEGSITVSSKVGEGTIVEVSFPLDPSESPAGSLQESEREFHSVCNGCNNVFSSYIKTGWGCNEERCPNQGG